MIKSVTVFRTAMIGGGLSYDVCVPVEQIPNYNGSRYTTILRDGGRYVDFDNASLPEEHFSMPQGLDRYSAFLAHQKAARGKMLEFARRAFPELVTVKEFPLLWVTGLLPDETSEAKIVRVEL